MSLTFKILPADLMRCLWTTLRHKYIPSGGAEGVQEGSTDDCLMNGRSEVITKAATGTEGESKDGILCRPTMVIMAETQCG
jgi:hypothetical protein